MSQPNEKSPTAMHFTHVQIGLGRKLLGIVKRVVPLAVAGAVGAAATMIIRR